MHAFLIVGKNYSERMAEIEKRLASWKISSWDIVRLPDGPRIGIGDIRDFERYLRLAPQQSTAKAGVLAAIDRLTPEAQNALLKTLEEPPPNTYLLAETQRTGSLLPTILSRFSLVNLGAPDASPADDAINEQLLVQLCTSSVGKRLQLIDPFVVTRESAAAAVAGLISTARDMMITAYQRPKTSAIPPKKLARFIRALLTAQSQLSVNVNQKLVLDNVIVHLV